MSEQHGPDLKRGLMRREAVDLREDWKRLANDWFTHLFHSSPIPSDDEPVRGGPVSRTLRRGH
jgi:hypothetical protein